jgi:hypothetical protein
MPSLATRLFKTGETCHKAPPNRRRQTKVPRGGPRSTSFKPGVSGNPSGRPSKPRDDRGEADRGRYESLGAGVRAPSDLNLESDHVSERAPPSTRISAVSILLDRGYGKARQEIEICKPNLARLTDEDLEELEKLTLLMLDDDEGGATAH